MTAKFGELPRAGIERVELADDDQLDRYGRRLLTAETLDAVLDG